MGTRSRIGMINEDGSITSIYCHWDGYPSHNGLILEKNYQDPEKVKMLMSLGDLSSLEKKLIPEGNAVHTFDDPVDGVCVFYGRDRKEIGTNCKVSVNMKEFIEMSDWCDYCYIFEAGVWFVIEMHHGNKPVKLSEYFAKDPRE
jgi:hypothetical protein